jgi:hypothetical protein
MSPLEQMAQAIMDELADAQATCEHFDLHEQDGAAEKLPGILERARALAAELNDLCDCEHLPPSRLAAGLVPPANAEPEHAQ